MPQETFRNNETGQIFDQTGQHIQSLEDYQSGVASGLYSGTPGNYEDAPFYQPPTPTPSVPTDSNVPPPTDSPIDAETPSSGTTRYLPNLGQPNNGTLQDALGGVDTEAIREAKRVAAREQIGLIEKDFAGKIAKEEVKGEGRLGQTRAMSSRSGTLGTGFGEAKKQKTEDFNTAQEEAINARKALQVAGIWEKFNERADNAVALAKDEALLTYQDRQAKEKERATEARDDMSVLAKSGMSLDEMSDQEYQALFEQGGFKSQEIFEATFDSFKPQAQQIDWDKRVIGNSLVWSGVDPVTGELKTLQFDVPEGAMGLQIIDGVPYNQVKNADGTITLQPAEGFEGEDLEGQSVRELRDKYWDSGATALDSREEVIRKIKENSDIYRKAIRMPGSGGGNPVNDEEDAPIGEIPDYNTFLQQLGEDSLMTIDPNSQEAKDAYEVFKQEIGGQAQGFDLKELKKLLSSTDKQKMIAQGLNINNQDDILEYINSKNTPSTNSSSTDFDNL